jgi:ELP3 family radical SAM enzyme/protein acetyltransferase
MEDIGDIEEISINRMKQKINRKYTAEQYLAMEKIVLDFLSDVDYQLGNRYKKLHNITDKFMADMMKKYKITPRKEEVLYVYRRMVMMNKLSDNNTNRRKLLENCFKKKDMRETSGVMVFAVLSSPYPETGEFGYYNDNTIYINENKISKTSEGSRIAIDPKTGIILSIGGEEVTIDNIDRVIVKNGKEKVYTKSRTLKVGDNVSKYINPMTGELRQSFSCPFDCYFCPSQPDMPKSYEDKEPAVQRSLRYGWNVDLALRDRFEQYITNGMEVDKLEVIVKGGTWTSYNSYYRKQYCRNIFYTANTFLDPIDNLREPLSLEEEQKINETAKAHIIGLTIETRPDYLPDEIMVEFRECGITRVELGFQHTDNKILKKVNRQHTIEDSVKGIAKLLSCGFKVDIHLMPGLPGSDYDTDREMVSKVVTDIRFRADQFKWYPVVITPYTVIKEKYDKGQYKPWIEDIDKLVELTVYFKSILNPWNRINRIQRDFTEDFICGGSIKSNLGDMATNVMKKRGIKSWEIRSREVRNQIVDMDTIEMAIREFDSYTISPNGVEGVAKEIFISFEANNQDIILGFLRLRLDQNSGMNIFDELRDCAMIRELHVYGKMNTVNTDNPDHIQHLGLGTKLMNKAKEIAREHGYKKISVIAGVGVRNYYRNKHSFYNGKHYLLCDL